MIRENLQDMCGGYERNLFSYVRFLEGYWFEDMINNFVICPQADKIINIDKVLYYKNSTNNNASKKVWKGNVYKSLEHIYLISSLVKDYEKLGL